MLSGVTRRNVLTTLLAAGTSLPAKAPQPATAPDFAIPAHACDCHTHIYGDPAKFPFSPNRVYTPEPALPEEMAALHRTLKIERVVIVTPSVYGTDNRSTMYGLEARRGSARGIAVIDEQTPERDLDAMDAGGVRGVRVNASTGGNNDPADIRRRVSSAADRIRKRNWHMQINTNPTVIKALKPWVLDAPVPVVFDHFGGAEAAKGVNQPGFAELVDLVRSGRAYVKISGAYRASTRPAYDDTAPLAKALIGANPDRILWGTDWPHPDSTRVPGRKPTDISPYLPIDDGRILNLLPVWAPDAAVREKILVSNPARLYRF
jgi:predicted TIM-barrel fold metal-dependent hydrolase